MYRGGIRADVRVVRNPQRGLVHRSMEQPHVTTSNGINKRSRTVVGFATRRVACPWRRPTVPPPRPPWPFLSIECVGGRMEQKNTKRSTPLDSSRSLHSLSFHLHTSNGGNAYKTKRCRFHGRSPGSTDNSVSPSRLRFHMFSLNIGWTSSPMHKPLLSGSDHRMIRLRGQSHRSTRYSEQNSRRKVDKNLLVRFR